MAEIQQVTTRSKGKQSECEVQEAFPKASKEWVEETNQNNVTRIVQYTIKSSLANRLNHYRCTNRRKPGRSWQIVKYS